MEYEEDNKIIDTICHQAIIGIEGVKVWAPDKIIWPHSKDDEYNVRKTYSLHLDIFNGSCLHALHQAPLPLQVWSREYGRSKYWQRFKYFFGCEYWQRI